MFKNKIYSYFLKEILKSFFTILFAFSVIAWTVRSVNFLDLIVDDGHSLITYLYFSFLNFDTLICSDLSAFTSNRYNKSSPRGLL